MSDVHVQVRSDDGSEFRWTMSEEAWVAVVSAAEVGLDGATPEATGLEPDVIEEAWEAVQIIGECFREGG